MFHYMNVTQQNLTTVKVCCCLIITSAINFKDFWCFLFGMFCFSPFFFDKPERKVFNHHVRVMASYTLLDKDVINVNSDFNNLFAAVQAQHFVDVLYANIT